jgi:tetratricopeptide (TPR) repeat protein
MLCFKRLYPLILLAAGVPLLLSCATSERKRNEAEAYYRVGVSEMRAGNNQSAFLKFQEALRLNPRNKETHNALGSVYLRLEELEKAETHFKRAGAIDKEYSAAFNNLCHVNYLKKDYKTAIRYCEKALVNLLYATPEFAYYNLGKVYREIEEYDKAIEVLKSGLRRNPIFAPAYYELALVYNAKKMYGSAAEAMESALSFDSRFQGDHQKAEREFKQQKHTARNPGDFQVFIDILHY